MVNKFIQKVKVKKLFKEFTEVIKHKREGGFVSDGEYILTRNIKSFGKYVEKL